MFSESKLLQLWFGTFTDDIIATYPVVLICLLCSDSTKHSIPLPLLCLLWHILTACLRPHQSVHHCSIHLQQTRCCNVDS